MKYACEMICAAALVVQASVACADDFKATRTPIGSPVEVTAGQEFYAETMLREVPAYRLDRPFKSSMAGSMGFPFSFSVDATLLIQTRKCASGWECFVPEGDAFRASHGLLGSVVRPGDAVGLRVNRAGDMQWYVDNSVYNHGMNTIWTRKWKKSDPNATKVKTRLNEPVGSAIERLIYLGMAGNGMVRIRHERLFPNDVTRDEFTFPIDHNGKGFGAVRGAEFSIDANAIRAIVTVITPMTSGIGSVDPESK